MDALLERDVQHEIHQLEQRETATAEAYGHITTKWDQRRPRTPYVDLLETVASYDRMGVLDDIAHPRVLEGLEIPGDQELEDIATMEGWRAIVCQDAGDGAEHDPPKPRPMMANSSWCPHQRAWDAYRARITTALDRFDQMATAAQAVHDTDLGYIRLELTLPPDLVTRAWAEITNGDGGSTFARMAQDLLGRLWAAWGLPGTPVGCLVGIHRTSSHNPGRIRPHLHVVAPAIYRDTWGRLRVLKREHASHRPLYRDPQHNAPLERPPVPGDHQEDVDDLDVLRDLWADVLEDTWGHRRETPQNANYGYGWIISRDDVHDLHHLINYDLRETPLEDLNTRLLHVGPDHSQLDVSTDPYIQGDTLTVRTRDLIQGWLTVRGLTPSRWQMARWLGELRHPNWQAFADELGIPQEDPATEDLWTHLEHVGRAWASQGDDRDRDAALTDVRHDICGSIEALATKSMLDRPPPHLIAPLENHVDQVLEGMDPFAGVPDAAQRELCRDLAQDLVDHAWDHVHVTLDVLPHDQATSLVIRCWTSTKWVTLPDRGVCQCGQRKTEQTMTSGEIVRYCEQIQPPRERPFAVDQRPAEQVGHTTRVAHLVDAYDGHQVDQERDQANRDHHLAELQDLDAQIHEADQIRTLFASLDP